MPDESYPLPLYVADVDIHKEKYVHVITDLIPLSSDTEYRKKYEKPVNELKKKYDSLPGLINEITDEIRKIFPALREFGTFTSSGRIFGNIPIEHGPQILELLNDYLDVYSSFVKNSVDCKILKKDNIRSEATDTREIPSYQFNRDEIEMVSKFGYAEKFQLQIYPKRFWLTQLQ